ncbi:DUF1553 domain-containing protein [Rhabdobacter roseus]|uniref:DUF1553 domain-containing protein n=1 Tax=Rhabdobacter roseus TaxID=1655419 RepID=A0A840U166_9BACT|nr:DUF1553 domain-containing protein [Rhabdobacter roseus]MBB5286118.1 hypothetical protein [Rhabdobacter roseus]
MLTRCVFLLWLVLAFAACRPELSDEVAAAYEELPEALDFNQHVKPILSDRCYACHGPDKAKQQADLRLDLSEFAYAELPKSPGKRAIVPGSLRRSEVFHRICSTDPDYVMPTPESHLTLTPHEKAVLIKWIEDGAEYKDHWAFIKPEKPKVPTPKRKDWARNPIDAFVLKRLEAERLEPSPEADRETLLRRLSLDLTGLPPTPREIRTFVNDPAPNAYEKQVDRLLASPHYGEKMAVDWLDLARFADSHGYTVDRLRDMSPYRDWVISAFNQNLPYDTFITWQLAGDLLPNPTRAQRIATAFNRNHPQNMEGGIVPEEFRVEYVADRTNTFGSAFMALTMGCARCHDHKYDPISQKEYYQLYSYFNNVKEAGQISWDDAMPAPTLLLTDTRQERVLGDLRQKVLAQEKAVAQTTSSEQVPFEQWLRQGTYRSLSARPYPDNLVAHFPLTESNLKNRVGTELGFMKQNDSPPEAALWAEGRAGKALLLNGDAWLDLGQIGNYERHEPFSVGLWVNLPQALKEGVIFHKGVGEAIYNFRGYHLMLRNNRLELMMAHSAPYNAITRISKTDVPRDTWIQLTVTYDGSSSARGYRLYLNGRELPTVVDQDKLNKGIAETGKNNPGLAVGAWWRGKGIPGARVNDVLVFDRNLSPLEVGLLHNPATWRQVLSKVPEQLSEADKKALKNYYLSTVSAPRKAALRALQEARKTLNDSLEKVPELMVMEEMPRRRPAYLLERGQYDARGEEVFPEVPGRILPMPNHLPRTRLGLAQWLTDPAHPLTARVAVNRYWQNYFERGLVKTSEDFGNQGELPSHPELLDWLAVTFRESGWDVKALQKLLVMSATYRQSSRFTEKLKQLDPENVLLARGPARRLTAEMIRDNVLAASGLLNKKIGGPSVKPYQPEGLWRINNATYVQDTGSNLYRRSLYTVWKRSVPHPTQGTFDAPDRSECTSRRQKTNTPLQALVTLNDPTFVEAAKVLGQEMARTNDLKRGVESTFLKLTGRRPAPAELRLLLDLYQQEYRKFRQSTHKTTGWLQAGNYPVPPDQADQYPHIAACAVVASTILNADATLTKR